jgi:hypothetical protein
MAHSAKTLAGHSMFLARGEGWLLMASRLVLQATFDLYSISPSLLMMPCSKPSCILMIRSFASGTSEIQKIDLILDHRAFLQRESVIGLTPGHVFFFFDRE